MKYKKSWQEGREAEKIFIERRGDNFIRRASKEEDINEHWDVLDSELGRIDIKAAKRKYRHGSIDDTVWWELRTVKRPPKGESKEGWGVPNGVDRLIAVKIEDNFYLIKPEKIIEDLRERCKEYYRGEFGLHSRPGRGDLMTILPHEYVIENSTCIVGVS